MVVLLWGSGTLTYAHHTVKGGKQAVRMHVLSSPTYMLELEPARSLLQSQDFLPICLWGLRASLCMWARREGEYTTGRRGSRGWMGVEGPAPFLLQSSFHLHSAEDNTTWLFQVKQVLEINSNQTLYVKRKQNQLNYVQKLTLPPGRHQNRTSGSLLERQRRPAHRASVSLPERCPAC